MNLTTAELAAFFRDNPRQFDDLLKQTVGTDQDTIRAGLRIADNLARPAWADTVKSSMSLSGQVIDYRIKRDAAND